MGLATAREETASSASCQDCWCTGFVWLAWLGL